MRRMNKKGKVYDTAKMSKWQIGLLIFIIFLALIGFFWLSCYLEPHMPYFFNCPWFLG